MASLDEIEVTLSGANFASFQSVTNTNAASIAGNTKRSGVTFYNSGAGILYILLGSGDVSTTNYSVLLNAGDLYECNNYDGRISYGFVGASGGTAKITEVTE